MGKLAGHWTRSLLIAALCAWPIACGDDEGSSGDAGPDAAAESGTGGGGRGGSSAGRGGSGRGGTGGRSSAGTGGMMMMAECSEDPPSGAVTCGGETCEAPTNFPNNMCVYPCCATVNGDEVCGAKSTDPMIPTGCEPPAVEDPSCPDVEAQGMTLQGCCNLAMGKCGILSTLRPGCITQSSLIDLPENPQSCGDDGDAGVDDDAGI